MLMGLMDGSPWNPVGNMQVNWCLFTARLEFEPTTEMTGLWGLDCSVLRISFVSAKRVASV